MNKTRAVGWVSGFNASKVRSRLPMACRVSEVTFEVVDESIGMFSSHFTYEVTGDEDKVDDFIKEMCKVSSMLGDAVGGCLFPPSMSIQKIDNN